MDLASVWATLTSYKTYRLQTKFYSPKIPRPLQGDRRCIDGISFRSENVSLGLAKRDTFRRVQNNSGGNLTNYVPTAVKIHTAVWRVVTDVSETLQTGLRRRHAPPKRFQTPITLNNVVMQRCRCIFELRAYTGSFCYNYQSPLPVGSFIVLTVPTPPTVSTSGAKYRRETANGRCQTK
jgi:hypothetical protein